MKALDNRASDDDRHLITDDGKLIKMDSPAFLAWLEANKSFRFEAGTGGCDSYRARKESLSGIDYWYAIKKVSGKVHKRFLGKSEDIIHARLIEISKLIRQPSAKNRQPIDNLDIQPELIPQPQGELDNRVAQLEQLVNQLQSEVVSLLKKTDNLDNTAPKPKEDDLQGENERLRIANQELSNKVDELTKEISELTNRVDNSIVNPISKPTTPDYTAIRDRVVGGWKLAKRPESKDRIALALNKFISELGAVQRQT